MENTKKLIYEIERNQALRGWEISIDKEFTPKLAKPDKGKDIIFVSDSLLKLLVSKYSDWDNNVRT